MADTGLIPQAHEQANMYKRLQCSYTPVGNTHGRPIEFIYLHINNAH